MIKKDDNDDIAILAHLNPNNNLYEVRVMLDEGERHEHDGELSKTHVMKCTCYDSVSSELAHSHLTDEQVSSNVNAYMSKTYFGNLPLD